jgi:flavodoxin I
MNTLVVYDSVFGNTAKVAEAIGNALGGTVRRVSDVKPTDLQGVNLLIVGSPTRAFRPTPAVSAYVKSLRVGSLAGMRVAAFDTRISAEGMVKAPGILRFMSKRFGFAAEKIAKGLQKAGGTQLGELAWFGVDDSEGPLTAGELERAAIWAGTLL